MTPRPLRPAYRLRAPALSRLRRRLTLQSLEDRAMPTVYAVTNAADSGPGTLRDVMTQAMAAGGPNQVLFDTEGAFATPQTITLESPLPTITSDLTISGDGATNLTIRRDPAAPAFGIFAASGLVNTEFDGLTITGGAGGAGSGITAGSGDITVDHCVITNNNGGTGGGIYIPSGQTGLTKLIDSTISGNSGQTGGVYFFSGGSLFVDGCTISGNTGSSSINFEGGGIIFFGSIGSGGFTIRNSTITGNIGADSAGGAGINFDDANGSATIENCTITDNIATYGAATGGGGIGISATAVTLTLNSCIVYGNSSIDGADVAASVGTITGNNNLIGVDSGVVTGSNNQFGVDPQLGILQDNGGPTWTQVPAAGSPAINTGVNADGLSTDQRGYTRTLGTGTGGGDGTDVGAVEVVPSGQPLATATADEVTSAGGTVYQFTVTYSDPSGSNNGIKSTSFVNNNGAVQIAGPNGFSALATYVSADSTTDGTPRTVTYQITPPGGAWDLTGEGYYTISIQPDQVYDRDNNPVPALEVGSFNVVLLPDTPSADATTSDVTTGGATEYTFTVAYSDPHGSNRGIQAASFINNNNAVQVTGPGGSIPAQYVSADFTTDGTPRTVTYSITPPGGNWDGSDDGAYTVDMLSNSPDQVLDLDGNPVPAGTIGAFNVNIPEILVVTNADDSGPGSLRDAMDQANASPTDDEILFDPTFFATPQIITLQSPLPTIPPDEGNLTIAGPGAAQLTVSGAGTYQVFNSYAPSLTMSGFTVTGGLATNSNGGGLIASGIVTLDHMVITGNSATGTTTFDEGGGGAIAMRLGSNALKIVDSTISGNTAAKNGGGVFLRYSYGPNAALLIEGSTISGNSTSYYGTYAGAFGGGGVFVAGVPSASPPPGFTRGAFAIVNSTIVNNTTSGSGGGIWANGLVGTLEIQDSTISGNTAATAGSFTAYYTYSFGGGGVGALTISPPYFGTPTLTVENSVISGNTDPAGDNDIGNQGYTNLYFSAVGDGTGFTASAASTGNLAYGTNPMLGLLADNGGPTLTMAPLPGSPLLEAGSNADIPAGVTTDQRGLSRTFPAGGTVDIGAVEVQPATPTITVDPAQHNPTNDNSSVTFDVTFDQPVDELGPAQIDLSGSTATGTLTVNVTQVDAAHYTVTVTGITGDGTVVASVLAGTGNEGLNGSGQNNLPSAGSATVTIDTTPPTVTVNQDGAQSDPTRTSPIVFDIQFSETVVGFGPASVTLGGTLAAFATIQSMVPGTAANSYVLTVAIAGSHTGTVTASIAAGAVTDPAGNSNAASTSTDNSVTFDNQPPTVTVTPAAGQGATVGGTSVVFDVTFSEPVPAFSAAAVDLAGTTAPGAAAAVTDSGDHTNFTVTVSGMSAGGTVAVTVDPGAVQDPAGNDNVGSNTGSVTYVHSGALQFSSPTYSIDEEGALTLTVVVTRTGGSDGPLSVNYGTADGTAVAGADYTDEHGTLSWAAGDTSSQTISIPILDDGGFEPNSNFTVALSNPSLAGALGTPSSAAVTIIEEAGLGFSASNFIGLQPDGKALVTVSRVVNGTGAVSVQYAMSDGTAVSGRDYTATSGTLSWADGDMADKTITIPMLDDGKSHGRETVHLSLSNATGLAVIGPLGTATLTIAPNHGITVPGVLPKGTKLPAPAVDADGDLITVSLGGKVAGSSLTYYLTDGVGPISEIDLSGTSPTKSTVTVAVKKPKGGTGDGRVTINEVDGTGLKSFTAKTADLDGSNGNGFNLTGFLGTLKIGNVENGADLNLAGPVPSPKSATTIAAGVVGDGTDITVVAPLKSLTAIAVGQGTVTAPSIGSIKVTGKKATKTVPGIAGDFKSDVTISGQNVDPVKGKALGSLSVAGTVSGVTISVGGNVGSVTIGSFLASELFAGYTGPDDGSGTFTGAFTVGPFAAKAKTHGFGDSYVIATNFKSVSLASADTGNGGLKFGFDFHGTAGGTFGGLNLTTPTGKVSYNKKNGGSQPIAGDLGVTEL